MSLLLGAMWLGALIASMALASWGWRGSRPFDTICVAGGFGVKKHYPRWVIWTPSVMIVLSGALLLTTLRTSSGMVLFPALWLGFIVYITGRYAFALKATQKKN